MASQERDSIQESLKPYLIPVFSLLMLGAGLLFDNWSASWWTEAIRLTWYIVAYLPVGIPVIRKGLIYVAKGQVFTEFFLMSIATMGAFIIGEYPEGVAVMVFYIVGELFQEGAVDRAKRNIKSLLDMRPKEALVLRKGQYLPVHPEDIVVGEQVQVRLGEQVPLDGIIRSDGSYFNAAALTGESLPQRLTKGDGVLAGMINEGAVTDIEVTKKFKDSSLARIIYLVQEATLRKAKTELFIRKFAAIYTPIVVGLAAALVVIPFLITSNYDFSAWLYRALIFLVISCPCALVISIPLGYFGGIGAASRRGILLKGANFLDRITEVNKVALDKTGTLTEGSFRLQKVKSLEIPEQQLLEIVASLESKSNHPIARSLSSEIRLSQDLLPVKDVREIKGQGIIGQVGGRRVLIGSDRLLQESQVVIPDDVIKSEDQVIHVAVDGTYSGTLVLGDTIKTDAAQTILKLKEEGIHDITLLSGDTQLKADEVARELEIPHALGNLLPEHKLSWLERAKKDSKAVIAYIGDGINDAPVIAMADVGIAMGGMGTDAAIETADVVIQSDQPSRIITAIKIGRATKRIVWQNISLAFGVKAIVLALGAWGIASMWEAVFADVGVALLAILNAIRLQYMRFE